MQIGNQTLVDEVVDYLRDSIINLRIKPGEQLNELELIKKMNISRSPLREAYRLLEGEGLIKRESRKGVFVQDITATDILDTIPIRAALEGLAAEIAALKITEKELEKLEKIKEKLQGAVDKENYKAYIKLNFEFHKQIIEAARNEKLKEILKNLGKKSMWFSFAALYFRKGVIEMNMSDHQEIYQALKEGKGKRASELMVKHIAESGPKIVQFFQPG